MNEHKQKTTSFKSALLNKVYYLYKCRAAQIMTLLQMPLRPPLMSVLKAMCQGKYSFSYIELIGISYMFIYIVFVFCMQ